MVAEPAPIRILHALVALALLLTCDVAPAFDVQVLDVRGEPLANAVVYLTHNDGSPIASATPAAIARMDQVNEEFVPELMVIPQGARLFFSNSDTVNHHVYSFSSTRRLNVLVGSGEDSEAIAFDKAGPVALGCNIHDLMLGHLYVVPSPYFGATGVGGVAAIPAVPDGPYQLHVWHPRARAPATLAVVIDATRPQDVPAQITVKARNARQRYARQDANRRY
ncbi:MAG: methylamine utilization protein [Pseudomonadota bacterium]